MKVSVAIATYQGADYIECQLDSIMSQTKLPAEIIVVDDGSTDGTYDILQSYQDEYPKLIELHKNDQNLGVTDNFVECIKKCGGDAIALCDQDDVWKPDKLERQSGVLESGNTTLVYHDSEIMTGSTQTSTTFWSEVDYVPRATKNQEQIINELTKRNFINGCTIMFDASSRDDVLPIPDLWEHDYYIALILAAREEIEEITEPLNRYRYHENQNSSQGTRSLVTRLRRGLSSGIPPKNFQSQAMKWRLLHQQFEGMDQSELMVEKTDLLDLINARCRYEAARSRIYESNYSTYSGLQALLENLNEGRYRKFGDVPTPAYVFKDLIGCLSTISIEFGQQ